MINVTVEKLLEDFDEIIGLCEENDEIITILKDGEPDLVVSLKDIHSNTNF